VQGRSSIRTYTCQQVLEHLDDYVDRELSAREMRLVQEHLERCGNCAAENRFEATWIGQVRAKLRRIALPPELMHRISRRLAEVAAPDAETHGEPPPGRGPAPGSGPPPR
jgi:anti-sigma factor RsiW